MGENTNTDAPGDTERGNAEHEFRAPAMKRDDRMKTLHLQEELLL